MFKKIENFINSKMSEKTFAILGVTILGIYYFVGLLSYITVPIPSINKIFVSSSITAVVIRAAMCALVCVFSCAIVIKFKVKIKWSIFILFCFALIMMLVCILISPFTYQYSYISNYYNTVWIVKLNAGLPRTLAMYFSSVADFAFAFCLIFILPTVINDKKKLLFLVIPIVCIGLLECFYSVIKEKDSYLYLINHPDDPFGGYGHQIGATFGNKEDWGAFLTVSFVSALAGIIFLKDEKKPLVFQILLIVSMVIFTIFSVLSLCKTSMLAILLCLILIAIGLIVKSFYKNKKIGFILLAIVFAIVFLFIVFLTTGGFGVPLLSKISDFLVKFIINRGESAVESRASLWLSYMQNVRGYNLFFGMGKTNVGMYTRSLSQDSQAGMHNGLAYFFASYGLIGFSIFVGLLIYSIYCIVRLYSINHFYTFAFLGILLAGFIFVLAEAEVLIVSTSAPVFMYNVLSIALPIGLYKQSRYVKIKEASL